MQYRASKNSAETRYSFHLVIQQKTTLVLAHCLELDLMASAETEDQAISHLSNLIVEHLKYALAKDLPLYSPAPSDRWAKIQNQKGIILDVHVTFTQQAAMPTSARPFYKHRDAELCLAP